MISDDLDSCQPHLYCDTLSPTPLCMLQPVTTMIESDQMLELSCIVLEML